MSDPACRNFRELLGVYVVGAIEPSERSMLDAHLNHCYGCREEFAGLAVLPAMLHRIPVAEAEEIALPGLSGTDQEDPAPRVFAALLTEVRARRRARRLRTVLSAAAAVVIAAGGSVAVTNALNPSHPPAAALETVSAYHAGLSGWVKYGKSTQRATEMWTRVLGLPKSTQCQFWITTNGHTEQVDFWTVGAGGSDSWHLSTADVPSSSISSFTLTSGGKVLLQFPAS